MTNEFKHTWEQYAASWRAASVAQKRALYEASLEPECRYTDPIVSISGWDALEQYMLDFHQQIPGGHFATTWFLAHHQRCIARWEMRGGDNAVLGEGISYGEFGAGGKLTSMTGFFATADANLAN